MNGQLLDAERNAPVYSEACIRIWAPVETVWSLMSDVSGWPRWNPGIASASIDGELTPGAHVVWRSGPGTIKSRIADVRPGERLSWTGSLMGIKAIHVWTLDTDDDVTTVTTQESWAGLVVRLTRRSSQRALDDALASGLGYLKAAAENTTRPQ